MRDKFLYPLKFAQILPKNNEVNIWDENKLALFIAFVVPGFIAIKVYELLSPSRQVDSSKQLIDAISYSCLNYAILLWPIFIVESSGLKSSHPQVYVLFYMVVLFFAPVHVSSLSYNTSHNR